MLKQTEISNSEDVLDIRQIIERVEELEGERETLTDAIDEIAARDGDESKALDEAKSALGTWEESDEGGELKSLHKFLDEMKGAGGDHQWRGDWYPVTLVRESYFKTYAEELAEELELIPSDAKWPANCIDWDAAARELLYDYTGGDFDGVTYYFR